MGIITKALAALSPRHFGVGGITISRINFLSRERFHALRMAFMYTHYEQVEGDYLEFGVARGRTLIMAGYLSQQFPGAAKTTFYGFDSFQGFPTPKGVDAVFERFKEGEANFPVEQCNRNLQRAFGANHGVHLVSGFYEHTLSKERLDKLGIKRARVVHIDCDMYESTKIVLSAIKEVLQDGTVILFDDWFCYRSRADRGEQRAFSEFLQENPDVSAQEYFTYANVGKSYIIHWT